MAQQSQMHQVNAGWTASALILITVTMIAMAWHVAPGWNWVAVMILMLVFILVIGKAITGRVWGILINERKVMSMSRFQMMLWTVVVLSAFFAIAIMRVKGAGEVAEPLAVAIDWQIWTLLGISTTSLVGTPFLYSNKKNKTAADAVIIKAGIPYGDDKDAVDAVREGILYGNKDISEAKFTDIFEGDELVNASLIDAAKVQMFFFTIIVAMAFSAEVFELISTRDLLADDIGLPILPDGLLSLMGISHAGYLGSKAIDHTPVTS